MCSGIHYTQRRVFFPKAGMKACSSFGISPINTDIKIIECVLLSFVKTSNGIILFYCL